MKKKSFEYKVYSLRDDKECLFLDKKRIKPKEKQVGLRLIDKSFEIGLFEDVKIKKKEYTFNDVYLKFAKYHIDLGLNKDGHNLGAHFDVDYFTRTIRFANYDNEGNLDGIVFIFKENDFGICESYSHGTLVATQGIPFKFNCSLVIDLYSGIHLFPANEVIDYQDEEQYIAGQEGFAEKINGFTTIINKKCQQFVYVIKQFDYRTCYSYFKDEHALSLTNYKDNPHSVNITYSINAGSIVISYHEDDGSKNVITFTNQGKLYCIGKDKIELNDIANATSSYGVIKGEAFSSFSDKIATKNRRPQFGIIHGKGFYYGGKFKELDAKNGTSLVEGPGVLFSNKDSFEITLFENNEDGVIQYAKKTRVTIKGENGVIAIGLKNENNQWDGIVYSIKEDCYFTAARYVKDNFDGEYIDKHIMDFDIFPHFELAFKEPTDFAEGFYDKQPSYFGVFKEDGKRNGFSVDNYQGAWALGNYKNDKLTYGIGVDNEEKRFDVLVNNNNGEMLTYGISRGGNFAYINVINKEGKRVKITYTGFLQVEIEDGESFTINCITPEDAELRDADDKRIVAGRKKLDTV